MDRDLLRKLQKTELQILLDVDKFCRAHEIPYSLYGGTALGAVRHSGFIPWDDDLDIVMTRDNFNRFCAEWDREPLEGYCLQNTQTDINCGINHTKIRKMNTLFLADEGDRNKKYNGIWIDIMVFDKVPSNFFSTVYLYWNTIKSFLYTRGNTRMDADGKVKSAIKKVLIMIPESFRERQMKKITEHIQKYRAVQANYHWMSLSCPKVLIKKQQFPPEIADEYIEIPFEGNMVMVFKNYKKMLEIDFGNYMELPPEEQRVCPHRPVLIKFE